VSIFIAEAVWAMTAIARASKQVGYIWDNAYPIVVGIALFLIIMKYGSAIFATIGADKSSFGTMYTAITGIFAVITGFLANFYCTIQSLTDTRLRRISKTRIFRRFNSYIKVAIVSGFVMSVISIPYIIFMPTMAESAACRLATSAWFGASAYALGTFSRIAGMLFLIFERTPPEDDGAG
jgi:hypothetical protein